MDVGDGDVRARRVGRSAQLAIDHHALDGPRRVPERARDQDRRAGALAREGMLVVEEHSAMVLENHVEVLGQGSVSDKACTFSYADHMPRTMKMRNQQARVRTSCRPRVP